MQTDKQTIIWSTSSLRLKLLGTTGASFDWGPAPFSMSIKLACKSTASVLQIYFSIPSPTSSEQVFRRRRRREKEATKTFTFWYVSSMLGALFECWAIGCEGGNYKINTQPSNTNCQAWSHMISGPLSQINTKWSVNNKHIHRFTEQTH